ncbi:RNA-binding transcriptional accessory protein [Pseudoflavonifractor sp. MSJ-30]|uniref:Tex family protein n=1 Tax=Pseudoflavonifractor sp. MSJ-30 TaxID=2841525 RepID=UPI001C1078A4|nr:Tex family protein [Pseudoflavonifractor sp. MSJ-30]MBU5452046.1 RNA-binding transcriptional accessory protein [Pseudoflavonifractor sp. MSJ-30]
MQSIVEILARELGQKQQYIENVVNLIDEGNTIPFIARYRKEMHGAMDDTTLRNLETRLTYLRNLQQRRDEVKKSIENQGKLTEELSAAIDNAATMTEVEDLYRPYKQKRRTRGSIAREKGLYPLAQAIFAQDGQDIEALAKTFLDEEKGVASVEDAIAGACDIIAENLSDDAEIRKNLRGLIARRGSLVSKADDPEADTVYKLYYDFNQSIARLLDHQILAINRGEKEGILKVSITLPGNEGPALVCRAALKPTMQVSQLVKAAAEDAFDRLIFPSVQREIRNELTDRASQGAIANFALNLKPLLMQPPVKGFVTMGLDPGYRNGCKVAVIDPTGKVLDTAVVYPTFSERKKQEAISTLSQLMRKHEVKHIAIGNGTASRETEAMTVELLRSFPEASYMIVNEAGASVYSASPLAAEEFPEYDVNLRSAVSIARRLQDPLAELVKIDPKAIGVGQYQHDCPQKELDEALGAVVEDCVNAVGVDANTASRSLLQQVSGLTAATAKNIVAYREENGPFTSRSQLKKVPKLGPKAFEQCAGFLRIPESKEVLDNTGVHPESYPAAKALLKLLPSDDRTQLPKLLENYGLKKAAENCGVGEPTLADIAKELAKPGRDPRDELPKPILRKDVLEMKDLKPGMVLTGTVRNVIDFGVFVDIGVHQDGLVHISEVCNRRLKHPSEAVQVGDVVDVVVLSVDEKRHRISLSMKQAKNQQK